MKTDHNRDQLKIKLLSPKLGKEIPLPEYATKGSAGMDLRACLDTPVEIAPGAVKIIPTGFAIELSDSSFVAMICARSGLAIRSGIALANGVGVIDSDYRGEIKVGLINQSQDIYTIQPGERIAQMLIMPVHQPEICICESLEDSIRAGGGFGSTGRM